MSIYDHIQQLDHEEIARQEYILDHKDEILELVKEQEFYFPERVTRFLLENHIEEIQIDQEFGFNIDQVIDEGFLHDIECTDDLIADEIWLDLYMSVWHKANQQKNERLITFLEQRIRNKYA